MGKKYSLKIAEQDDQLIFTVGGRIDSVTVREFGDAVAKERQKYPNGTIVFDCGDLEYISSAGLRVFLSLRKKEKAPIRLINVSPKVSEILEVTGFYQLFDVSKGMRDVSEKNVRRLGGSNILTIYRVDDDTLLKVYSSEKSLEAIEQERNYSRAAFMCGVPTIISYDVVTYKGHYGMLYELVQVDTVSSVMENSPDELDQFAAEMGDLLKLLHSSEPEPDVLPKTSDIYEDWARKMAPWLKPEEIASLISLIQAIPEGKTVVYGNFHARNVFVQGSELLLINMAGISCGNPIYDLGTAYMHYLGESPQMVKALTGLGVEPAKKFWNGMMRAYYETEDDAAIERHEETIRAAALLRAALTPAVTPMVKEEAERFVERARKNLFPEIDNIKSLLSAAGV